MTEDAELFALSGEAEEKKPASSPYDRTMVEETWDSSEVIEGNDPAIWRKDALGLTICRSEYGNRYSSFGWEIVDADAGWNGLGLSGGLKAVHVDNL